MPPFSMRKMGFTGYTTSTYSFVCTSPYVLCTPLCFRYASLPLCTGLNVATGIRVVRGIRVVTGISVVTGMNVATGVHNM